MKISSKAFRVREGAEVNLKKLNLKQQRLYIQSLCRPAVNGTLNLTRV